MLVDSVLIAIEAFEGDDFLSAGLGIAVENLAHAGPCHVLTIIYDDV